MEEQKKPRKYTKIISSFESAEKKVRLLLPDQQAKQNRSHSWKPTGKKRDLGWKKRARY